MIELTFIDEPNLLFNYDQSMLEPRDGLSLFGPLDKAKPEGIRWAVVGPKASIARVKKWVDRIQKPVVNGSNYISRPLFPGFETVFKTKLSSTPVLECEVNENKLWEHAHNTDKHQRVYRTVDMYSSRIKKAHRTEDVHPDLWIVVIPEYIYQYCRPNSTIPTDQGVQPTHRMSVKKAINSQDQFSLFPEDDELAEEYYYEVNFHHQLKARLLKNQVPTQIIREIKIAYQEFTNTNDRPIFDLSKQESAIAWNLSTAIFYKAGGRPWKLGGAREGVCYIGLVFKEDIKEKKPGTACCAAQMFLDSGDGVVFKGAVGPWYRGKKGLFHLDRKSAKAVVEMCIDAYAQRHDGSKPNELFIHGRTAINDIEWEGFKEAAGSDTKVVGVRIRKVSNLKLFREKDYPILRGVAYLVDGKKGYLWTTGMIPRLRTYPGREVPNPLQIDICKGNADIRCVMADILALTKLNYNACNYGDGLPVTLKFANAVGEILTAGPAKKLDVPPLSFKYYI